MIPVLMAVCLLAGFGAGWLTKRHRLGLLAENNHWLAEDIEAVKGADLDADVAAERALRLSGEQPAVDDPEPPEWMDQSGYRAPTVCRSESPEGVVCLRGYGHDGEHQGSRGGLLRRWSLGTGGVLDPRLIHLNAERQALNEQNDHPDWCCWSDDGLKPCGKPWVGLARLRPDLDPVPLCDSHYRWACHGVEDEPAVDPYAPPPGVWDIEPAGVEDEPYQGPRSLPGPKVSD